MPCIPILPIPNPQIPSGFTLALPFPELDITIPFPCCRLPPLISFKIPSPIPKSLTASPAFLAALKADIAIIRTFLGRLQPKCPRM
jgi:hypothetical protein